MNIVPDYIPVQYLYRINGTLREVHRLTVPHSGTEGHLAIEVVATGQVLWAHEDELVRHG